MKFNSEKEIKGIITNLVEISISAGKEIMNIYSSSINYSIKNDGSPLTLADTKSHNFIVDSLKKIDHAIPIISEEGKKIPFNDRSNWSHFWLIDPLDGTKEFINRNGEFTVNIARIQNGVPEIGVVHVPVTGVTYIGNLGKGAWKVDSDGSSTPIKISKLDVDHSIVRVVTSRSHRGYVLDQIVKAFSAKFDSVDVSRIGSSLKLCLLAEGKADIYPRLAPTCEWDTGAAHAVLLAAGGEIFDTSFQVLRYNQTPELLNPNFIALADKDYAWKEMLLPVLE